MSGDCMPNEPYNDNLPVDLRSARHRVGDYTKHLLNEYSSSELMTSEEAFNSLAAEHLPFAERLTRFVSGRLGIPDDPKDVKRAIREASDRKGLGISSALLSQWFAPDKGEIRISTPCIFKLCLALELTLDQAVGFVYDCLYQNWFNYRNAEELVYIFFIGLQDLFGNGTYEAARSVIEALDSRKQVANPAHIQDVTGYTKLLGAGIKDLLESGFTSADEALDALDHYLESSWPILTGVQRSALRTYDTYFKTGGVGLRPLTEMYREVTGFVLPETSYLDMTGVGAEVKRKRLLWGALNRDMWVKANGSDWDILNKEDIKLEHHSVKRMLTQGMCRGNIVALLFFHFALENKGLFTSKVSHGILFQRFYESLNMTLVDECGMMPLHPRKPFDRIFMLSIANSKGDPIVYLNELLERFYSL